MKIKYIILFVSILVIYSLLNSIESFGTNMIGVDPNGAQINVSSNCTDRTKDQCTTTHGCQWDIYQKAGKEIKECNLKKGLIGGYGKKGINIHIPTRCKMRKSYDCEATHGCSWDGENEICLITQGWLEDKNLDDNIVHFQKKCSQRPVNYCMIGPDCFLDGGVCYHKPIVKNREREDCKIDRKNLALGEMVDICRNVRQHWTPEHDKKDDIVIPIPKMMQTKTCWHCAKAI